MTLTINLDRMRVDDLGVAFMQGHAAVDQQIAIDTVQSIDLAILVGDQCCPLELGVPWSPSEPFRVLEFVAEVRSVNQQFFRDTANVYTGTT